MVFYSGKKLWAVSPCLPKGENRYGLNGSSPQYLSRMRFSLTQTVQNSVSTETGLVQKLYLGRCPWVGGDGCFASVG